MPFLSRPPSPLFARRMKRPQREQPVNDPTETTEKQPPDILRLYPLGTENTATQERQRTVNPLTHRQQPKQQAKQSLTDSQPPLQQPQRSSMQSQQQPKQPLQQPQALTQAQRFSQQTQPPQRQWFPQQTQPPQPPQPHHPQSPQAQRFSQQTQPPHPQRPVQPPQPNPVNLPPERAAEQFQRVNKGLPDGVHYEPLDEDTLRLLREKGHLPGLPTQNSQQAHSSQQTQKSPQQVHSSQHIQHSPQQVQPPSHPSTQPPAPNTTLPTEAVKIIEGMFQDGRNALVFYNHMATTAQTEESKDVFTALSKECKILTEEFNNILVRFYNHSFTPSETEINTRLPFEKALTLALYEENKSINTLAGLIYILQNTEVEKILQRLINKKVAGYNQLIMLDRTT